MTDDRIRTMAEAGYADMIREAGRWQREAMRLAAEVERMTVKTTQPEQWEMG